YQDGRGGVVAASSALSVSFIKPPEIGRRQVMQHLLQVSRKIDYALRAMIHLAGLPEGERQPLHEVSTKIGVPKDFLAKIVRVLVDGGLVNALRGPHGGVAIARAPEDISFLEVIEAVEGPVQLNVCLDDSPKSHACVLSASC